MADSISWLTQYRAFCGVRDNHVTPDKALGKDTCVARTHSTLWALGAQVVHSHSTVCIRLESPRRNLVCDQDRLLGVVGTVRRGGRTALTVARLRAGVAESIPKPSPLDCL